MSHIAVALIIKDSVNPIKTEKCKNENAKIKKYIFIIIISIVEATSQWCAIIKKSKEVWLCIEKKAELGAGTAESPGCPLR